MSRSKDILTTGEVAALCKVAPRTVSKWFDSGRLKGYRIPGSKDRRIPIDQLIRFMKDHDIPLNGLASTTTRVLLVECDADLLELIATALNQEAGYEVITARSAFEAGALAESGHPHVLLLDAELTGLIGRESLRAIRARPSLAGARIIALTSQRREGEEAALRQLGFDAVLVKPFEMRQAIQTIEAVLRG